MKAVENTTESTTTTAAGGWADLPADLLVGDVLARLPFPSDRARVRAVCRAWRSAVRHHLRKQPPWIVLPDGSFCTGGHDGGFFFQRIPGLPENATCLAAAGDAWLALDCTDDVFRRTPFWDNFCYSTGTFVVDARPDVKHTHNYLLHNPFSNVTVPLPELDAIVGHVAETFEIRKVLMRSETPDDLIAVTTNNWNYNIILCRPGKGTHVLPHFRVIDAAFLGDTLYGVTSGEELVAFHLGEDEDGRPKVTKIELVIRNPMAAYYEKGSWTWPQEDDDSRDVSSSDEDDDEAPDQEADGNEQENQEEDYWSEEEEVAVTSLVVINGDVVSDNEVMDNDIDDRWSVPYEAFDEIYTARYLVKSLGGKELLLVRHQHISTLESGRYTTKVEVLKADVTIGNWVSVTATNGLAKDEALFISRSFSKSTRAQGDIEEGLVYYATNHLEDAFDTRSWTIREMTFRWPWQRKLMSAKWLTWLFPPELVV